MSKVKFRFESDLEYQHRAIEAVCGLFEGQGNSQSPFTVLLPRRIDYLDNFNSVDCGTGNKLSLSEDDILANLRRIQEKNGQPLSVSRKYSDERDAWDFSVEMETGTGKTYVYLRTIFELHKRYGFSKFMIVVPSIAIKEGVFKSIELMQEHFRHLYEGAPMHPTLYDGGREDVRNYARSNKLEIMVATIQALYESGGRIMHSADETGIAPVTYIRQCRPIVIVDEPQNIAEKGESALISLNPLCTLRYSATHRNRLHPLYSLNAVDASNQKLVKEIEVAGLTMTHNAPNYLKVTKIAKNGSTAEIELLDDLMGKYVKVKVKDGDELGNIVSNEFYTHVKVDQILENGVQFVPDSVGFIPLGQTTNDPNDEEMVRMMIRVTIKIHLERSLKLKPRGIKVLSLFFLDSVSNYRDYENEENNFNGRYADIFEEEYAKLANKPEYIGLWNNGKPLPAREVHAGYFAVDKAKKFVELSDKYIRDGEGKDDREKNALKEAYRLIMQDKDELLSMEHPLQFIFSHTALREGWDNPNVFQVCVLRETKSPISRRQIIGRGLRICVDKDGKRVRDEGVNTLTVVAKEHFNAFAEKLQKEYERDGFRFGVITVEKLGAILLPGLQGEDNELLGQNRAKQLLNVLVEHGLIDGSGMLTDETNQSLREGTLILPPSCGELVPEEQRQPLEQALMQVLKDATRKVNIRPVGQAQELKVRDKWKNNALFLNLWERIKHRSIYDVSFDTNDLINNIVKDAEPELNGIPAVRILIDYAGIVYHQGGIEAERHAGEHRDIDVTDNPISDIIGELADKTNLTRRTIVEILMRLKESTRKKVRVNCVEFVRRLAVVIQKKLQELMVNGISYRPVVVGEHEYNLQQFLSPQQIGDIMNVIKTSEKCLTDSIVCDHGSSPERRFADDADKDESVKFYVKLPKSFSIPTPLGSYNPDWALVKEDAGKEVLYFVVETKSTSLFSDLRDPEKLKIKCAYAHFDAIKKHEMIENPVRFCGPVSKLSDVH